MAVRGKGRARGSARLSPRELESRIAGQAPAPVYLLVGEEAVLRDRALKALRDRCVDPEFQAFNCRTLNPSGLDGATLAQELRVMPMGGGARLVVIEPAEKLLKDQLKALEEYAADPSPATCLVLVAGELKEGLKKAFRNAVGVECGSPYEDRIPAQLMDEARRLGVRLEPAAAEAIAGRCGRDLSRAVSELAKAAVAAGPGSHVTRQAVEKLAGGDAAGDVFKVASALARGDIPAAVKAARFYLETEDRAEPRVLYELGLHLRRLLAARAGLASGSTPRVAARAAGVFWKDQEAFASGLGQWSEQRIHGAYRRLLETDRRVKRGSDGLSAIEAYLWSLPRSGGSAPAGRPR